MSHRLTTLAVAGCALLWPAVGLAEGAAAEGSAVPRAGEPAPQGVLTKAPVLEQFVEAVRPPGAETQTAEVILLLTVAVDGSVGDVQVQSGTGGPLDQAAVDAARRFRFTPAEVDGKPAPVQLVYRYAFTLETQAQTVAAPVDAARPVGVLKGTIVERGTRKPLPGIAVKLLEPAIEVYTDAEGRFEIPEVPAGKVVVRIDDASYYTIEDRESVEAGQATDVKYYLEKATATDELVVVGRRVKKDVARQTLTLTEIRKIPGASGDALKVVQNLPGVARAPFGGGQLIVRGSNPGDSAAVINRHIVPLVYHFGGLRSVFASSLLESIDFYPGNFGAEYGRFSGGIVDVKVRRPKTDRLHGLAEADFFDAGFVLEGPVLENGAFALAARRSYIDFLLPLFLPDDANIDFTVAPRYYDYQALYDWKKGRHQIKLYFFGSDDELKFLLDQPVEADPGLRGTFRNETSFYRGYLNWIYRVTDDITHDFSLAVGQNYLFFQGAQSFYFDNDVMVVTARDDLEIEFSKTLKLRTGVDFEGFFGHIEITAPQPPKEGGDQGNGTPLSTMPLIQANRDFDFINPALWFEIQSRPTESLLVVPGVRLDYDHKLRDFSINPRLNARWQLVEGTTLKGGVGGYMQRPQPDESDPDFGNPDIDLEHSVHTSAGVEQKLPGEWTLDASLFYKHLYEQATLSDAQRSQSPNAFQTGDSRDGGDSKSGVPYENQGKGRVYGLELLVRKELTERFFGWLSYTLSRSERQDGPGESWRLFDFDQTHILSMLGNYALSSTWDLGFRWRFVSGNPESRFYGCTYDSDTDTCAGKRSGGVNADRVPAFHQLDLRVERKWVFDLWLLTAYLEIQNAYNRANPEGYTYNYLWTERKIISSLPILPSFGLRGEF